MKRKSPQPTTCSSINKKMKKCCAHEGCKTIAVFGNEDNAVMRYCVTHKLEGMVDVKNKRCVYEGCDKQPSFGNKADMIASHCAAHKLEGMVDVKNKRCSYKVCKKRQITPML